MLEHTLRVERTHRSPDCRADCRANGITDSDPDRKSDGHPDRNANGHPDRDSNCSADREPDHDPYRGPNPGSHRSPDRCSDRGPHAGTHRDARSDIISSPKPRTDGSVTNRRDWFMFGQFGTR